jgi:hypothetical protein
MARLSHDALLLLAYLNAKEPVTIKQIAIHVFRGYNPETPDTPTPISMVRAKRAALSIVADHKATALPDKKNIVSVKSNDSSGGSVQAQFLMNLMIRGGGERRHGERRAEDLPHADEHRAADRRASATGRVPPLRIHRTYTKPVPRQQSPFDIVKNRTK